MDDSVRAAMAKWPNVPDVFGWLRLDGRGQWWIQDERLSHPAMIEFIQRNYAHDRQGWAFFQNGPQRVFVQCDVSPYVVRYQHGDWRLHDGEAVFWIGGVFLTAEGMLLLDVNRGKLAVVDDRDLTAVLALLHDQERRPLDDDNWVRWLDGTSTLFMTYRPPQPHLPVQLATLATLHEQFHLQVQPEPEAE